MHFGTVKMFDTTESANDTSTDWNTLQISSGLSLIDINVENRLLVDNCVSQVSFIARADHCSNSIRSESEWLLLLCLFQSKTFAKRIKSVHIADDCIPSHVVPTLLWQFRVLEDLVLDNVTRHWHQNEWQCLSNALERHSHLKRFSLRESRPKHVHIPLVSLATVRSLRALSIIIDCETPYPEQSSFHQTIKNHVAGTANSLLPAFTQLLNHTTLRRLACVNVELTLTPCRSIGWTLFLNGLVSSKLKVLCLVRANLEPHQYQQLLGIVQVRSVGWHATSDLDNLLLTLIRRSSS